MLGTAAAVFDRAATMAASAQSSRRRHRNRSEGLSHGERLRVLGELAERYDNVTDFFLDPTPIAPRRELVRSWRGGRVEDMRWSSNYPVFCPEVEERYRGGGKPAAARMWLHDEPRPLLILVHGYLAGQHSMEERVWPSRWLFRGGLDLAFFVLPFHGVRGERGRFRAPPFPGSDPRMTIEGFRQAVFELQSLVRHLQARGHADIGVMGMSLGGYTTALAATVEPSLRCAIPVIPLTSIADFARDQGRLGNSEEEERCEHRLLDEVHRVVSPLHRKPVIAADRVKIVAAEADRITPIEHARRLGRHFGVPVSTWHGGHLLQFGRSHQFRTIGRFLHGRGMMHVTG